MSGYIIPTIILACLIYGAYKKINIYDCFVFGAKSSIQLVIDTLPNIIAIFILIELFTSSNLHLWISNALAPILNIFGIPSELCGLILLKPFSGSGGMAMLEQIFTKYGVDSYLSRAACAIAGSSEAIFYVSSVYFVKTKITKLGPIIWLSLIANFVGAVVACNICKVM